MIGRELLQHTAYWYSCVPAWSGCCLSELIDEHLHKSERDGCKDWNMKQCLHTYPSRGWLRQPHDPFVWTQDKHSTVYGKAKHIQAKINNNSSYITDSNKSGKVTWASQPGPFCLFLHQCNNRIYFYFRIVVIPIVLK